MDSLQSDRLFGEHFIYIVWKTLGTCEYFAGFAGLFGESEKNALESDLSKALISILLNEKTVPYQFSGFRNQNHLSVLGWNFSTH